MKTLDIPSTGTKIDYITIKFMGGRAIGRLNRSSIHTVTVPYSSFSHRLSAIHRAGGRVISVSMPHELRSEIGLAEVTTAKVAEPVAEPLVESVMEVLAEEIVTETEAIAVETPELTVEPLIEPVIEPVAEVVPEPVIEPITEPVVEPIAELIPEPVVEPIPEPVVEPVAETVAEPIAELAVEPELSIKSKKPRASSKSSGFAKPKVDTAAKATRSPRKPKN